jgi:uncharacterized protein (TIGR02246 family)
VHRCTLHRVRDTTLTLICVYAWLALTAAAHAGPEADARAALDRWVTAFNSSDVERVVATYSEDALMFGSASAKLGSTLDDRRAYFRTPMANHLQVKMDDAHPVVLAEDAVMFAGGYTFFRTIDGEPRTFPSRYTFVLARRNGTWSIVHHHSSPVPKPL